jgi:hypothetical protein
VDITAKCLDTGGLVFFQQWDPGKTDKQGIGEYGFHRLVELPRFGPVALINKHHKIALGGKFFGEGRIEFLYVYLSYFCINLVMKSVPCF